MEDNMKKNEDLLENAQNAVSLTDEELDEASGGGIIAGAKTPDGIKVPNGIKAPQGAKPTRKINNTKSPM